MFWNLHIENIISIFIHDWFFDGNIYLHHSLLHIWNVLNNAENFSQYLYYSYIILSYYRKQYICGMIVVNKKMKGQTFHAMQNKSDTSLME